MENRSDHGGALVAICLILILLLLIGGAGIGFVYVGRKQAALVMQARMAEVEARIQAERARSEAQAAADSRAAAADKVPPGVVTDSVRAEVESVLRAQVEAWNRGDIDAFVEHYWKSEGLTFSTGGKTTRGWAETLNRYKERYPTAEEMGRLRLGELEITVLCDSAALVLGELRVERDNEPLSGSFSLVVRKFDDRWLIVHDHTSQIAH